ncbi:MAG: nitronate monooxygenase [Bryobacteraceae bacterium]
MGVAVSNWRLANAVCREGQLGVVSGTALDQVLARRLQDGDPGGHMRRALDAFPFRAMAERVWNAFHIPGGKAPAAAYRKTPLHERESLRELQELCVAANFVEVFLAKEGHGNPVGINYLEKIQTPHLPSIFGAMLAGVDYVLMGAGIPLKIPGILDAFARYEPASYPLTVAGAAPAADADTAMHFAPLEFVEGEPPELKRPFFLAIIASNTLALTMSKKANGRVDGFIVEGHTAGGHNAPPRGKMRLSETGEPVYGERDRVDLDQLRELGLPFWLAGGFGSSIKLREALAAGAAGVQVGTAFAFCDESGFAAEFKQAVLSAVRNGNAPVFTDPVASPTGFPFKCVRVPGTVSEPEVYADRPRICDLGYLREFYWKPDGSIGSRCAAEPVSVYSAKGGHEENTVNRRCLCNALMANIGHPQVRAGKLEEPGLITAGDGIGELARFLGTEGSSYSAAAVIREVLG